MPNFIENLQANDNLFTTRTVEYVCNKMVIKLNTEKYSKTRKRKRRKANAMRIVLEQAGLFANLTSLS